MGFKKKNVNYDYVTSSEFVSVLLAEVQLLLDSFSEEDATVTKVVFDPTFSLRGACRIFELVGAGNSIGSLNARRDIIVENLKQSDTLYDLALKIYKDACMQDVDVVHVAAAFTDRCPVSKKIGIILYWKM